MPRIVNTEKLNPSEFEYILTCTQNGEIVDIDGSHHWTGKINHGRKTANVKVAPDGEILALHNIKASSELFFDYGDEYWVNALFGKDLSDITSLAERTEYIRLANNFLHE